jgi:CDP-diacylglycerol--serine O-phosphatidyltransferase
MTPRPGPSRRRPIRRFRSHRGEVSIRALVPNTLTTIALCAGLASLHFSAIGEFDRAMGMLFVAAVFDTLDGRFARLFGVASRFGAMLDSLADFLSFGIAPGMLLYHWMLQEQDVLGRAAIVTYVVCAALRLARFTAGAPDEEPADTDKPRVFQGVPSPAAAGAVLIAPMLQESTLGIRVDPAIVIGSLFLVGWLMISRIPAPSLGRVRIRRRLAPLIPVAVGLAVVLATKDPFLTVAFFVALYLVSIPVTMVLRRRRWHATASAGAASPIESPAPADDAAVEPSEPDAATSRPVPEAGEG